MMVNGKMIKRKEKEYFIIIMERNMMVNGKMIKEKEKEYILSNEKKINNLNYLLYFNIT